MNNKVIKSLLEYRYRTNLFFALLEDNNYFNLTVPHNQLQNIMNETILYKRLIEENKLYVPSYILNKRLLKEGGPGDVARAAAEAAKAVEAAKAIETAKAAAEAAKAAEGAGARKNVPPTPTGEETSATKKVSGNITKETAKDVPELQPGVEGYGLAPEDPLQDALNNIRDFIAIEAQKGVYTHAEIVSQAQQALKNLTFEGKFGVTPETLERINRLNDVLPEMAKDAMEAAGYTPSAAAQTLGLAGNPTRTEEPSSLDLKISDTTPHTPPTREGLLKRVKDFFRIGLASTQIGAGTPTVPARVEPVKTEINTESGKPANPEISVVIDTPSSSKETPKTSETPIESKDSPKSTGARGTPKNSEKTPDRVSEPDKVPGKDKEQDRTPDEAKDRKENKDTKNDKDIEEDPKKDPDKDSTTGGGEPPPPPPPPPPMVEKPPEKTEKNDPWLIPFIGSDSVDSSPYVSKGQSQDINLGLGIEAIGKYATRQVLK